MILETAMGDAYAVAWEFVPPALQPVHDWSGYKQRPQTGNRLPSLAGSYTDDTLRTIANARVLLAGQSLDRGAYVEAIKAVFAQDQRLGWSQNFQRFLADQAHRPTQDWFATMQPRNTNGALMGAAVMGMVPSVGEAAKGGHVQALVTHDEEAAGYASAISVACFGLRTRACGQDDLLAYVRKHAIGLDAGLATQVARTDRVDMSAARTCGAVVKLLVEQDSMTGLMDATLALGGDTDSVAAAVFGIASTRPDLYAADLPEWMEGNLEGHLVGMKNRVLLRSLDAQLALHMG